MQIGPSTNPRSSGNRPQRSWVPVLSVLLAFVGILGPIQAAHAAYDPFELWLEGEASVSGQADSDTAYPSERGYDLTPVTYSKDLSATGCSGTIALSATPAALKTHARIQSDPAGPGCVSSGIQATARVTDTLRFEASEGNIDKPLRLDLEFDFSDSYTYDVEGWPDASSYMGYTLWVDLSEVTETYPDGSIELGETLGEGYAAWGIYNGTTSQEIQIGGKLQLVPSDAGGEFGPGQTLTLRVTTERGAQVRLQWQLDAHIQFNNSNQPSGTPMAVVETASGNGLELINAVVRDPSNESIITDSGLAAESGFDYLAVPEPAALLSQAVALLALFLVRRALPQWNSRKH